jgi:putative SOS response-associated peptidase YedK
MCGRYELHSNPVAIALAFGLAWPPEIHPRYNIAPMQDVPIVRLNAAGERELMQIRWGLVPRWAKDPSIGARMINARAETVAAKPAFQTAFRRHRCLLPADGFYEWRTRGDGARQPLRVGMKDGSVFGLAGLYERWLSPEGETLDTCTIITTEANALLRPLHDRMPVIVPREAYEQWLDPTEPDPDALLDAFPADAMTYWPVSMRVNSVKNDDPACIEPIGSDDEAAEAIPEQVELPVDDDAGEDEAPATPTQAQLF